jgi:hypothetical protein
MSAFWYMAMNMFLFSLTRELLQYQEVFSTIWLLSSYFKIIAISHQQQYF